jgi:GNAT superfamily N-acetyltransferase
VKEPDAAAMGLDDLSFRTIDLGRHEDTAVAFRRDSYVCSFGSDEAFGTGADYIEWLRERIGKHPAGHVHVWRGEVIIGQLEMATLGSARVRGYVNLFYLRPEARGCGFGAALHEYAVDFMHKRGAGCVRLRVSPSNQRAVAYYLKHGWHDIGACPDDGRVHVMELDLG